MPNETKESAPLTPAQMVEEIWNLRERLIYAHALLDCAKFNSKRAREGLDESKFRRALNLWSHEMKPHVAAWGFELKKARREQAEEEAALKALEERKRAE